MDPASIVLDFLSLVFSQEFLFLSLIVRIFLEVTTNLIKIQNTSTSDLKEMSYNSKMFFEDCVRNYFNDPTKNFLEWMEYEEE